MLKQRLRDHKTQIYDDFQIEYSLKTKYADGDVDEAYELLTLFYEAEEGYVRPYNPSINMLGAENRGAVTCWLDSLLFAMFARLGSFEPMLYTKFDSGPENRLAILVRLWVNMLRSGKLIQEDLVSVLHLYRVKYLKVGVLDRAPSRCYCSLWLARGCRIMSGRSE